jgi:hypothetical protein
VEAAIFGGDKRQAERSMPSASRKKVKRERAKAEARKGNRALYDLPQEMIKAVQKVAAENETSASQIAKLAIWMFLNAVRDGDVDVRAYRVIANKNPKYNYAIELPE